MLCCLCLFAALSNGAIVGNAIRINLYSYIPSGQTAWASKGKCLQWQPWKALPMPEGKLARGHCYDTYVDMKGMYYMRFTTTPEKAGANELAIITVTSLMKGMSKPKVVSWKYVKPENPPAVTLGLGTYRICVAGRDRPFLLCGLELYKCKTADMCGMEVKTRDTSLLSERRPPTA